MWKFLQCQNYCSTETKQGHKGNSNDRKRKERRIPDEQDAKFSETIIKLGSAGHKMIAYHDLIK